MPSSVGSPTFVEISWVQINEEDIARVATRAGLSLERIHQYLKSDEQDNNILIHFAYFRVYPTGKFFQSYVHTST